MKILQISYRVPYPPHDGGAIGIYNITKGLSEAGCEVYTLSMNTPKHSQPEGALKDIARQFDVFVDTSISPFKLIFNYLFKRIPYNIERFISVAFSRKIEELIRKENFDVVHVEGTFAAYYIDQIRRWTNAPVGIRAHNIEYVIWERLGQNDPSFFKRFYFSSLARRIKKYESVYYNKFDSIIAITNEDKGRLEDLGIYKPIEVVPAGVVVDKFYSTEVFEEEDHSIFMLGALDWLPNQEAVMWFLDHVWDKLYAQNKKIVLHIAGKNTPDYIKNIKKEGVVVHGFVDDLLQFIKSKKLMLVPLLSGGGMRIKIIEGMAAGKCILSSPVGAEGIEYTDQQNIVICRTVEDWVKQILYFLQAEEERKKMEKEAILLVNQKYDNRTIAQKYIQVYQSLLKK